jgi:hypothetical protein
MDHAEEQEMEWEALDAIFGSGSADDFKKVSDTACSLTVIPNPGEGEDTNHVSLTLSINMPPTYPEVAPEISVALNRGLVSDQQKEIEALVAEQCEENLGAPMIFTVAEAVREWLVDHNEKGAADESMYGQMMRRAQEKAKEKVLAEKQYEEQRQKEEVGDTEKAEMEILRKRREGTPCNRENFLAWKAKFDAELAEKRLLDVEAMKDDKRLAAMAERSTGFDLFNGKGSLDDIEAMADAALEAEITKEEIDEGLFDDEDDDDLDDLDYDDDEEEEEEDGDYEDEGGDSSEADI